MTIEITDRIAPDSAGGDRHRYASGETKRPGVMPFVGQREAAGVAQHVGMGLKLEAGFRTGALDKPRKAGGSEEC
jgi:hypothetical protein